MTDHVLRLFTDRLEPRARIEPLPACNRVVYVAGGMATLVAAGAAATLAANSGWFNAGAVEIAAGAEGAVLLRYELVPQPQPEDGLALGEGVESRLTLDAVIALDDADGYLMRCDKVELPPGGVAYTHTHQGGGMRCLLEGEFNVKVHDETKTIAPFEAWFEAGPDPVLAWAPDDKPGTFSRVMILPCRLKGKSSIRYVDPADADKPKPQRYTIYIDAFIEP